MHLWLGQAAWHDAQGEAWRGCSYRRRILAEPHRLQPDPHPEIGCRIGELRKETRKSLLCRAKRLNHQHKAPYRTAKAQISRFFRRLLEAGVRQFSEWGNTEPGRHILI